MEGVLFIKQALTIREVLDVLENPPQAAISAPPQKPKAGHVFLFRADDPEKQGTYMHYASTHRVVLPSPWLGDNVLK